jgi:hypothetical protein
MRTISVDQPDWVCDDCGVMWGNWWNGECYSGPKQHCATYHYGECGVCNKESAVTEARDFGYLRDGWVSTYRLP